MNDSSTIPSPMNLGANGCSRLEEHSPGRGLMISLLVHGLILALGFFQLTTVLWHRITSGQNTSICLPDSEKREIEVDFVDVVEPLTPVLNPPEFIVPTRKEIPTPPKVEPHPVTKQTPEKEASPTSSPSLPGGGVQLGSRDFPKPEYPYEARTRKIQGVVTLSITVSSGTVTTVAISNSSGFGILDSAARSCILQKWKFPVGTNRVFIQEIEFQLAK